MLANIFTMAVRHIDEEGEYTKFAIEAECREGVSEMVHIPFDTYADIRDSVYETTRRNVWTLLNEYGIEEGNKLIWTNEASRGLNMFVMLEILKEIVKNMECEKTGVLETV